MKYGIAITGVPVPCDDLSIGLRRGHPKSLGQVTIPVHVGCKASNLYGPDSITGFYHNVLVSYPDMSIFAWVVPSAPGLPYKSIFPSTAQGLWSW